MVGRDIVPQRHSFASGSGAHASVDRTVLDRLSSEVGHDTVREMCTLFLADLDARIGVMKAAFAMGDAPSVARAAHALSSAARLVGAAFLADLCVELDRHARSGRLDDQAAATLGMVSVHASKAAGQIGAYLVRREA